MPDTLLAEVSRSNLNPMLAAFHRAGYGRVIRVIDPDRAPLVDQLNRAGVRPENMRTCETDAVVICIHAPKRTTQAAAIAVASGATAVELTTRGLAIIDQAPAEIVQIAQDRRSRSASRRYPALESSSTILVAAD